MNAVPLAYCWILRETVLAKPFKSTEKRIKLQPTCGSNKKGQVNVSLCLALSRSPSRSLSLSLSLTDFGFSVDSCTNQAFPLAESKGNKL